MSLLYGFHRPNLGVLASDDAILDCPGERASKFRVLHTSKGPLFLGAVGRLDLAERLFSGCQRLCSDISPTWNTLCGILREEVVPPLIANRPPAPDLIPSRDGLQICLIGFDEVENRIRSILFLAGAEGIHEFETTSNPDNCFFALGWLEEKPSELQKFSEFLARHESFGPKWIAGEMGKRIDANCKGFPGIIGSGSYFAALNRNGLLDLGDGFPLPPSDVIPAPAGAHAAVAGVDRFYVGSIMTPVAGGPDTIGNNDGGGGAQNGMMVNLQFSGVTVLGTTGTASVTNPNDALAGDYVHFATLSATASGVSTTCGIRMNAPSAITERFTSIVLKIALAVTQDNPNGTPGLASVIMSASTFAATFVQFATVTPPATPGLTVYQTTLPNGLNLSQVQAQIALSIDASATTGGVTVEVYNAWLECTQ